MTLPEGFRPEVIPEVESREAALARRHPAMSALLRYFQYEHLPRHLAAVSKPFALLAHQLADDLPSNAETTTALRKLLEAKDCAVRAALD